VASAPCVTIDCIRLAKARGLCGACYHQLYRLGQPARPVVTRRQARAQAQREQRTARPYSFDVLLEQIGARTIDGACERLSIGDDTYRRYETNGLTEVQADRLAVRAGLHPAMVWPTWVQDGLTPLDEVFLAGGWRPAWLWNERSAA
jgi:hypothetical protein